MKIKVSLGEKIFRVFNYTLMILLSLICIYPFWHAVMASFSDNNELMKHYGFLIKPAGFSLAAYARILKDVDVWYGFKNTAILLGVGVPLSMVLSCIAAYFLSRKNVMLKKPLLALFMFTMYFSGGTIPYYLNLKDLDLLGNLWGLILPGAISTWNVLILKTSFESIPQDLCDAARIDGAGHIRTLLNVILPLSKASLAVIALYYGLGIWNAWFWASVIIRKPELQPLQLVLRNMIILASVNGGGEMVQLSLETVKYSTMIVSIIPIMLIYPFIQKHFTKGVMVGAVKG